MVTLPTSLGMVGSGGHASGIIQINWTEEGFNAQHANFNLYESLLSPANVAGRTNYWSAPTANDGASPAFVNGVLYVGEFGGQVTAFTATTGAVLWSTSVGNVYTTSPTVVKGVVYVGSGVIVQNSTMGTLYALDAATGAVLWSAAFQPEGGSSTVRTAPVVVNGFVYVATEYGRVAAFKASGCGGSTCHPIWETPSLGYIENTPAYDHGMLYFGSASDAVIAVK